MENKIEYIKGYNNKNIKVKVNRTTKCSNINKNKISCQKKKETQQTEK